MSQGNKMGSQDRRRRKRILIKRFGAMCAYCGSVSNLTIDHIRPLSKGGTNRMSNLQLLCEPCNRNKGSGEAPSDWLL